jgi:hypothetical protein
MDLRTIDARDWAPELPECIGIYHAYLRGYNRDVRAHKMFIVCSGGLEKACDAFCNLLIDVGEKWTAKEVADSEEVWWLRKACQRGRCRLIKGLADAFGLKIETIQVSPVHLCKFFSLRDWFVSNPCPWNFRHLAHLTLLSPWAKWREEHASSFNLSSRNTE